MSVTNQHSRLIAMCVAAGAMLGGTPRLPLHRQAGDDAAVYASALDRVLDSMFVDYTARDTGAARAIILSDSASAIRISTELRVRLLRFPGVDSVAVAELAIRGAKAISIRGGAAIRTRRPLRFAALAEAVQGARDPTEYWRKFYARFPGTNGLTEVSAIGYSRARDAAVTLVTHRCGGRCGTGWIVSLARENGQWRVTRMEVEWVS